MMWVNVLIELCNEVSSYFYYRYFYWHDDPWPMSRIGDMCFLLCRVFSHFAWGFYNLNVWWLKVEKRLDLILDWDTIWWYILRYVPNLTQIRDWFYYWPTYIWNEITEWWSAISNTVLEWVNEAKQWALNWINYLNSRIDSIQALWDDFVKVTLPTLPNWLDIDNLIASWFQNFSPFWEGWQDFKAQVAEFFEDPEQWFYDRLDSFFERFW